MLLLSVIVKVISHAERFLVSSCTELILLLCWWGSQGFHAQSPAFFLCFESLISMRLCIAACLGKLIAIPYVSLLNNLKHCLPLGAEDTIKCSHQTRYFYLSNITFPYAPFPSSLHSLPSPSSYTIGMWNRDHRGTEHTP